MSKKYIFKLKDVANITMGQSPKSEYYNQEGEGTPFLQGNSTFGDKYPKIEKYTTKETRISNKNEVLMSVRAPVGDININPFEKICVGRGLCSIQLHNNQNEYLYYFLKANQRKIQNKGTGTVFSAINKSDVENIEIYIPDEIQIENITKKLKVLDDKIENNNAIIANLEKQAQAIFKSWFVDFEPFQKEEFIDNTIGLIPTSFESISLGELYKLRSGYAFKSKDWTDKGFPVIKIKDIQPPTIDLNNIDYVNDMNVIEKAVDFKVCGGEIVMALTGATTGKIGIIPDINEAYVNQRVGLFLDSTESGYGYLYGLLNQEQFISKVIELAQGSAQANLSPRDVNNLLVPYNKNAFEKYNSLINPMMSHIALILNENQSLRETRDTLLPKLMSGEIRVEEAIEVEEM